MKSLVAFMRVVGINGRTAVSNSKSSRRRMIISFVTVLGSETSRTIRVASFFGKMMRKEWGFGGGGNGNLHRISLEP